VTDLSLKRFLFQAYCVSAIATFLVIALASCTSAETFEAIFNWGAEFFHLGKSSVILQDSPGFGHFVCYAILGFSLAGVFLSRSALLAVLVAGAYGVLMECVQMFIPSRDASLLDIGVNLMGIAVGLGLYRLLGQGVRFN